MENKKISKQLVLVLTLVSFAYTLGISYYFHYLSQCNYQKNHNTSLAMNAGDTFSYLGSVDNYIAEGTYYFINTKGKKSYAGRMPFYGTPYYLFRLFLPKPLAYDFLVLLQIVVYSLSIVFLALLAYNISKSKLVFWLVYATYLFNSYTTSYVASLITESFSTSFLVFFLFYYQRYSESKLNKYLIISSIYLSLLTVLRPYFILLYLFIGIHFIIQERNIIRVTKKTLITSLSLLILLSPWIVRNYLFLQKFIPLQEGTTAGYGYSRSDMACRGFIMAWGGNFIDWEPNAAGCYFIKNESIKCEYQLPDYVISKSYTREEVEKVRHLFFKLQDNYSDSLDKAVSKQFKELTQKYISDKPFYYYFLNPLKRLKSFVIQSNTYNLPIHSSFPCYNSLQGLYKIGQYLLYYVILVLGTLGILFYLIKLKHFSNISSMLSIPYLYILVLFPFILGGVEWRFLTQVFPILVLWSILFINFFIAKKNA